jgi:hypothetical protein
VKKKDQNIALEYVWGNPHQKDQIEKLYIAQIVKKK